jgi:hypothetical protein
LREQIDLDWMFEDIVGSSEAVGKVLRRVSNPHISPALTNGQFSVFDHDELIGWG